MHRIVNDEALDTLFRQARSHYAWLPRPVSDTMLRALWELAALGPTSGRGRPARTVFVRSQDAKARLGSAVPARQREAILTAPIAAIVGYPLDPDLRSDLRPGPDRPSAAQHDAALQAAYVIVASRALGLDCGPIWDFDAGLVDAAFFPEGTVVSNFLCALGYGEDEPQRPAPGMRSRIAEACNIL